MSPATFIACWIRRGGFLPESWSEDRDRCRAAAIPDEMVHRTKWRIGLELHERAIANGVRFEWLTFDEGYGQTPAFLHELDRRGQRYVAEVPTQFAGWLRKPDVLQREHHSRPMGRPRTYPRLTAQSPTTSFVKDLFQSSPILHAIPWERFHVKDTHKGPMVWEAKAAPFYLKKNGLPTRAHWLIVARNVLSPEKVKFFVSNAPPSTPLEILLHVAFNRWHVERCFQDEKNKLGLSHFEVRNYLSLRRHWTITAVSHLFLAKTQLKWRGEKPGTDGLPTSPGDGRLDASRSPSRPIQNTLPPTRRRDNHASPTTQRQRETIPSTNPSQRTPKTRNRTGRPPILRAG